MKIVQILLMSILFFSATTAMAAPILLTISETDKGQTQAWWPNQPGTDSVLREAFEHQGMTVIHVEAMRNAPRLSPTVYGQKVLSNDNARTLSSLYGATMVLNGNIAWKCDPEQAKVHCRAAASMSFLYGRHEVMPIDEEADATAQSESDAKKYALARLVTSITYPVLSKQTTVTNEIPALISKPVMLLDPLPDADALVAIRKQLKRVSGVEDVAERWVSNGVLALEINPGKNMSLDEFSQIIQGFMNESTESLVIRETRRSERGVVLEVVKY